MSRCDREECGDPQGEYQGVTCPYAEEINNKVVECNCCPECVQECLWDI